GDNLLQRRLRALQPYRVAPGPRTGIAVTDGAGVVLFRSESGGLARLCAGVAKRGGVSRALHEARKPLEKPAELRERRNFGASTQDNAQSQLAASVQRP